MLPHYQEDAPNARRRTIVIRSLCTHRHRPLRAGLLVSLNAWPPLLLGLLLLFVPSCQARSRSFPIDDGYERWFAPQAASEQTGPAFRTHFFLLMAGHLAFSTRSPPSGLDQAHRASKFSAALAPDCVDVVKSGNRWTSGRCTTTDGCEGMLSSKNDA